MRSQLINATAGRTEYRVGHCGFTVCFCTCKLLMAFRKLYATCILFCVVCRLCCSAADKASALRYDSARSSTTVVFVKSAWTPRTTVFLHKSSTSGTHRVFLLLSTRRQDTLRSASSTCSDQNWSYCSSPAQTSWHSVDTHQTTQCRRTSSTCRASFLWCHPNDLEWFQGRRK